MTTFNIKIKLGNAAMQTSDDVAQALIKAAQTMLGSFESVERDLQMYHDTYSGEDQVFPIIDDNGQRVGRAWIDSTP